MKKPTNWEIIALLSMGFQAKDIIKLGYSSSAYKYQNKLKEAKKIVMGIIAQKSKLTEKNAKKLDRKIKEKAWKRLD